jgi:hypothetical protein
VTLRVTQGTEDAFFTLTIVGVTDGRHSASSPRFFAPFLTWDRIRPQSAAELNFADATANVIAVRLQTRTRSKRCGRKSRRRWRKWTSPR